MDVEKRFAFAALIAAVAIALATVWLDKKVTTMSDWMFWSGIVVAGGLLILAVGIIVWPKRPRSNGSGRGDVI